jgi:hypothetical protein
LLDPWPDADTRLSGVEGADLFEDGRIIRIQTDPGDEVTLEAQR